MALPLRLSLQLFLLLSCSSLARPNDLYFNFTTFVLKDEAYFDFSSGTINTGALQLTYDSASNTPGIMNSSGRITYTEALQLWDDGVNYTASFNTSFLLNMGSINSTDGVGAAATGGGMAFTLCSEPARESEVENSYGGFLGLFNQTIVNRSIDSEHRLLAIEFDTFKDSYDPDDNHVGIDSHSPVSFETASLNPSVVNLRTNRDNTSVWIDYDGRGKKLSVFIVAGTDVPKPDKPVLSYVIDLRQYLPQNVYLGFSGSTGIQMETHCVLAWSFISEGLPSPTNIGLIIALTVAGFAVLLALPVCFIMARRWRRAWRSRNHAIPQEWTPESLIYGPRKFKYKELSKATNNFSADCVLGEGGFGAVYKGTLADPRNSAVAVKRITTPCTTWQGTREFIAEVTIMGRLRHRNLVQLLGWCQETKGRLLLVYEYMPNGSLNQWIHGEGRKQHEAGLEWETRYKVMTGLATGLLYLHEEWEMVVVHRDLKPSNVLLDAEYNARLGDFGLARLIESGSQEAETKHIAGTPGYMAPECLDTGMVTKESDLYSFGTVGMEVATGCRPSSELRRRLWKLHQENRLSEAADSRLASFHPEEMERLLLVSLACCHPDPALRPSIRQVLHALSSLSSPLIVEPHTADSTTSIKFSSCSSSDTAAFSGSSNPSAR